jgi:uncharacterized protein DUF4262
MALTDYEQRIVDSVAKHGWFCVSVFGDKPDDVFSYSVGFSETLNMPECIIFGFSGELAHKVLWEVFHQLKAGAVLSDGRRWSGLIEGFDCISRPVHPSQITREHFNSALWYWGDPIARGRSLEAYQFFWPGVNQGLFPWERGCDQIVRDHQPALYLPNQIGQA